MKIDDRPKAEGTYEFIYTVMNFPSTAAKVSLYSPGRKINKSSFYSGSKVLVGIAYMES